MLRRLLPEALAALLALGTLAHAEEDATAISVEAIVRGAWNALQRGDCGTALPLLEEAARKSPPDAFSANAAAMLGYAHESGHCVARDDAKALEFYQLGSAGGDPTAIYNVGAVASRLQDHKTAAAAFRRSAAAGNPRAQAMLGEHYRLGLGVVRDDVAALAWYAEAARQNDAIGEYFLGYAAETGFGGATKNPVDAERWYRRSAEQGYALAQHALGHLYATGRGLPIDAAEGVRWFKRASEQQVPDAMASYGWSLAQGLGIAKDVEAALSWYRRAAQFGQPNAMHNLAGHYARGEAVPADKEQALYWAMLAYRFYEPGPKRQAAYRFIVTLQDGLGDDVADEVRERAAGFVPRKPPGVDIPRPPVPAVKKASVRERLRTDQRFRLYAAFFEVSLDSDGDLRTIRFLRTTDPASGTSEPIEVEVPAAYVEAVRAKLSDRPPAAPRGASIVMHFYFSPDHPLSVISDLDAPAEAQP